VAKNILLLGSEIRDSRSENGFSVHNTNNTSSEKWNCISGEAKICENSRRVIQDSVDTGCRRYEDEIDDESVEVAHSIVGKTLSYEESVVIYVDMENIIHRDPIATRNNKSKIRN
jgi:hypothetical protein